MLEKLQKIILQYSYFAVLLPLFISLRNFKRYSSEFKVLSLHLLLVTLIGGAGMVLWYMNKNNLPLLHVYTILEFSMIAWFYHIVLRGMLPVRLLPGIICIFVLFALFNAFFLQGWFQFNTLPRSIQSLLIICLSLACYFKMLSGVKSGKTEIPVFWINTGFLFYFSGALLLFSLSNYILPLNHRFNIYIWTIHALFSILLYLFIFIGLWNYRKK